MAAALHRPTSPAQRWPTDGWLGTPELPGYRAGNVVARLADLPEVDAEHLYFNLLLLDGHGELQDHHSGPCPSLARGRTVEERSRFVRVVAELLRHAPSEDRGLTALGQALSFIRERGVEADRLLLAAQLLDDVSTEDAVAASLCQLLALSLGEDEAARVLAELIAPLAQRPSAAGLARPDAQDLPAQVAYVVRAVGKTRARHYLRQLIDFRLVPTPDILGL